MNLKIVGYPIGDTEISEYVTIGLKRYGEGLEGLDIFIEEDKAHIIFHTKNGDQDNGKINRIRKRSSDGRAESKN